MAKKREAPVPDPGGADLDSEEDRGAPGDTRQRILEAARYVFMRNGFAGARVRDIAAGAGVNLSLLNYHFQSKEKIFEIVFSQTLRTMMESLSAIASSELPLFDKIRRLVSLYIDTLMENPLLPAFIHQEIAMNPMRALRDEPHRRRAEAKFRVFIEQVDAERARGGLRNDVSAVEIWMDIMSMCVFPFLERPIFQGLFQVSDEQFRELMLLRKQKVAETVIRTIQR